MNEDILGLIMTSPVVTVTINDTIGSAAAVMVRHEIGAVVVLDRDIPIGIITERDIVKLLVKKKVALQKPLKSLLAKPLITATSRTSVQKALETMLRHKIRRLPIIDRKRLLGIVTEKDLMRWVVRVSYEPEIPPRIRLILAKPNIVSSRAISR
jgi:CBS domain-containing protein